MKVVAFPRELQGTGASRRLRIAGKVPGIVYGGEAKPVAIELDHNALFHALKKEVFHSSILNLEIGDKTEQVLLRDVQHHPFKQLVLHVDFQRVDASTKIHVKVPLHFTNAELSPAVKLSAAVISHVMTEIDVSCLPGKLPEYIEVDLSSLEGGASVHISDLKFPEGVSAVYHGTDDPAVVTTKVPVGGATEGAAS
ncbi:50S ribosomal protein L25/general stress protein Ctc [Ampullimonas aquatilis]|uniref:50S ribosomal protein L25/general stress protein Ctc n=1 Tax=Ampullimonas aquatilis TaxID=1341549 RepID=UPI003C7115B9